MWLMKGLAPDHKTIAEFRRKNKQSLRNVLKQCARMCLKLGLIEGNTLFVDGTKIRANASIKNVWTEDRCREALKKADANIERILRECEDTDCAEEGQPSHIKMEEKLADQAALKAKVHEILKELRSEQKKQHNTTDPDSAIMKSQKGSHAGYNVQIVVDRQHGLIVSSDAVNDNIDSHQLPAQIIQANETLSKPCTTVCADSGYAPADRLAEVDAAGIKVIVPSTRQASGRQPGPFDKTRFRFDKKNNRYICPEGHVLVFHHAHRKDRSDEYRISRPNLCLACHNYGQCTNNKLGRSIHRLWHEETKIKLEREYLKPESHAIYKLRKEKVELPFGHIKRNLKFDAFLLRGKDGVKAETALAAACFNIARMITMLGVGGLIRELQG
jgi:hypothetical protein